MPRPATVDDVLAAIDALPRHRTRYVGIDGFGGSGKTALAAAVAARIAGTVVVPADAFASPRIVEWDWPRLQEQVLDPLRDGRPARYQRWDWAGDTGAEWHDVPVGGVVVVEGVSATRREVVVGWDLTVWVEAPFDVRRNRILDRDGPALRSAWRDRWWPEERAWATRDRPAERVDLVVSGVAQPAG